MTTFYVLHTFWMVKILQIIFLQGEIAYLLKVCQSAMKVLRLEMKLSLSTMSLLPASNTDFHQSLRLHSVFLVWYSCDKYVLS